MTATAPPWLLLGLKGTMSEAELHLLKQRMLAGKQAKARRGELAIALPTGYVRRGSGEAALDPDEQVQTVVRLVFAKFAELGTLHAVLRWLVDHDVELGMRLRCGPDKGELVWRRPNRMTLQNILHSPVYAGIYAYGRRRVDPHRQQPGRPSTGRVVRAEGEGLWAQRLERAQIAADRARRCYRLAEPENRLVVRQLEADWEAALAAQQRLREDYDRFTRTRPQPLTVAQQQAIADLAADIPGLWAAPPPPTPTASRSSAPWWTG